MPDPFPMETRLPVKPFKLGTTSFIFPGHIVPNVKKLGPFFDEIELLLFESRPKEVLPSKEEVKELFHLSQALNLTYNIHLPVDVSLTCESWKKRQTAADTLLTVIDLLAPLTPTTHTLHLEMPQNRVDEKENQNSIETWKDTTRQGLESLLSRVDDPGIISVETLDYPFSLIETLVAEFDLSVCIDAGHAVKYGHDLLEIFDKHFFRTPIIHLHGVAFAGENRKDHTALDLLPENQFRTVQTVLERFTGVVSLEVFNLENLNRSLAVLSGIFQNIMPSIR